MSAQAVTYEFENVSDWGGPSRVDISPAAIAAGSGATGDILSWEVSSLLFNNLDGAGLSGTIYSSDPGVTMSASFSTTPDRQYLYLNLDVEYSDSRYTFHTWPQVGLQHGARAEGFDLSHAGGSYWQHTTQGTWHKTPEAVGTLGLLLSSSLFIAVGRRRWSPA